MQPEERLAQLKALEVADFGLIPTRHLEVDWLYATCLYELFDGSPLSDGAWDRLTKHLWTHRNRLSPYFYQSVPMGCLQSSTGSGIDWDRPGSVPWIVKTNCEQMVEE